MLQSRTHSSVSDEEKTHADAFFFIYALQIVSSIESIIKQNVIPHVDSPSSVTFCDLQIMITAQREGHPIAPSVVATTLAIDPATVTRAVKRLEKAQLIKKTRNGGDLRSFLISTTPEGDKISRKVRHIFHESCNALDRTYNTQLTDAYKTQMLSMLGGLRDRFQTLSKHKLKLDIPPLVDDPSHEMVLASFLKRF